MSIQEINLKSEKIINDILELSKKEKFYYDDIYINLKKEIPKDTLNNFLKFKSINEIHEHTKKWMEEEHKTRPIFGSIYINEKNQCVGFMIYNIDNKKEQTNLLFLLVDEKYRNIGIGKKLLKDYLKKTKKLNYKNSVKTKIRENSSKFYLNNGFKLKGIDENFEYCFLSK